MRGSVTELTTHGGYGRILGEDGCELYFDEGSLDGADMRSLSIGDWVEYREQNWGGRIRVVMVKPIAGPSVVAGNDWSPDGSGESLRRVPKEAQKQC